MDPATLIGVIGGTLLVFTAIFLGGDVGLFFDLASALLVLGGTAATIFIRYPLADVMGTLRIVRQAFFIRLKSQGQIINDFIGLANIARRDGLLSLERLTFDDPFVSKGVGFCVDGAELRQIESILLRDIQSMRSRHQSGQAILRAISSSAPAFGMIGTLIGLVQMLTNMDDPKKIGPGMAVAILTTLYGALIAYLFAIPIADKLAYRSAQETERKLLMLEGILALKKGENPRMLEETLHAFLAPKERELLATRRGQDGPG